MPTTTRTPRTKCYLHEMRHPVELPYEPHKYHICVICQFRLLEIAKTNFRFARGQQVIRISIQPELAKEIV